MNGHESYARETTFRRYRVLTLIKIGTAGGRSLVRLGWKWANLTVRALSIALPDLSVGTVADLLATYPHSDPVIVETEERASSAWG